MNRLIMQASSRNVRFDWKKRLGQIISVGVFVVCGCYSTSSAGSVCSAPIAASFDVDNAGILELSDCIDGARGADYYTDKYSFAVVAGQQVSISLTSSAFDSFVYLKNSNGDIVATDDDGGGSRNSRIPATSGYYTLPIAGTYVVEVTSFGAHVMGNYSLLISRPLVTSSSSASSRRPPCLNHSIQSGVTINGTLTSTSCRLGTRGDSKYSDNYAFHGAPGQTISILLTSVMFDTYVSLKNPNGAVISSDDDGSGDGTNSRIPATSGVYTIPAGTDGDYIIEVSSYSNFATGDYSLLFTSQ